MENNEKKSKTWLKILFALTIAVVSIAIFSPWKAVLLYLSPIPDEVSEEVERSVNFELDGMVVYVQKGKESAEFYAAGWHDRVKKIPADPKALSKIASISKLYNAVAITKLVHSGKLSLDKTLADYFPELKGRIANSESISLRLMIQHRSGIPNYTDTPNYWNNPTTTAEEALALVLDKPANFMPGEDYEYSNTNYLLLSQLVEKATGISRFEYIQEVILKPLDLKNTFSSLHDVKPEDLMSGYHIGYDVDLKEVDYSSMIATTEDVGIFVKALNDGTLLNEGEQSIYSSVYVYEHSGWIPGYQSFSRYYKDIDTVVVLFVNTTDDRGFALFRSEVIFDRLGKILSQDKKLSQDKNK